MTIQQMMLGQYQDDGGGGGGNAYLGATGVWMNGGGGAISYKNISTTGNTADFGDCTITRTWLCGGFQHNGRGVTCGGSSDTDVIEYITVASPGNATDFGDLGIAQREGGGCASNAGRGVGGAGYKSSNSAESLEYAII